MAALIVLATATGSMVLPAGAVPEAVSTPVEGTFTTKASTFDLTDVVFQGTWDPDTGALEGKFVFPAVELSVTAPIEATIGLQLQQPEAGTGTVDLVTNEATFSADLVLALLTIASDANGLPIGSVAPCNYSMSVELTGLYDPDTGFVDLSDSGFPLTAVLDPDRCFWETLGGAVSTQIDAEIVSSANAMAATFDLGVADAVPPPPPPPLPPPPPPEVLATPPAVPTVAAPRFAG